MIVKSLIKIAKTDPWILNHDHSSGGEIACVCPGETTPGDDLVEQDHDKVEDVGDDLDDGDIDDVGHYDCKAMVRIFEKKSHHWSQLIKLAVKPCPTPRLYIVGLRRGQEHWHLENSLWELGSTLLWWL